jgi:hypothetical protein
MRDWLLAFIAAACLVTMVVIVVWLTVNILRW